MNPVERLSRRTFVGTVAQAALAAGSLVGTACARAAEARKAWAVTCRDVHLREAGAPDCWSAMQELGVAGVEAHVTPDLNCPGLFHPGKTYRLSTDAEIHTLKSELAAQGRSITALMMANRFDTRLDQELAWARRLVPAAQNLGVETIRIDVAPEKMPHDEFLPFAIKACRELCAIADGTPIRFGIENHGRVTNDPEFLDRLFDGVGSDRLGLTLDTANFYWYGHPLDRLYALYEKFASRAFHTHCKNIHYPAEQRNVKREIGWAYDRYASPVDEGDIDFRRVVDILRRANYRGDLCLEDESLGRFPKEERRAVLKREIEFLRQLAG